MEIERLMTDTGVQEDNSDGGQPKSLLDRYFTFGEEYLEHQEMEKLLNKLMQAETKVGQEDTGVGVKGESDDGVRVNVKGIQEDPAPAKKVQMKISDMFEVAGNRKKEDDAVRNLTGGIVDRDVLSGGDSIGESQKNIPTSTKLPD